MCDTVAYNCLSRTRRISKRRTPSALSDSALSKACSHGTACRQSKIGLLHSRAYKLVLWVEEQNPADQIQYN